MKYGKKVIVSRQGFHIDSKSLQAVGIRNGSRCRGIFIPRDDPEFSTETEEVKDLIVSPFPFYSWGCIVKLQIRVNNNTSKGLNRILSILSENNFNILSINFTFGGYKHKTFHLIGELWELRPEIKKIRKQQENNEEKIELENHFRVKLYEKMYLLKKLIVNECGDILYDVNNKINPSKEATLSNDNFLKEKFIEIDESQKIKPIEWKWLETLATYAFKTKYGNKTLYFNYNTQRSLLSLENKNIDEDFLKSFSNDQNHTPVLALSAYDAENGYIKLRSFNEATCNKEILQFDFSYSIYLTKMEPSNYTIKEINKHGSRGIINTLLEEIIKSTSKKGEVSELTGISTINLSRPSPTEEQGMISVHGIFKRKNKQGWQLDDFKEMSRDICTEIKKIKPPENQHFHSIDINIRKVFPYTTFVSIRENFSNRITDNLPDILKQEGFGTKTSGTYTDDITENVMQDMSVCDSCIQIYSLSIEEIEKVKSDGEKTDFVPDNSWLLFEFGIARAKSMPIVRMIDVTHLNKKKWVQHLRTDNDKLLIEFDSITEEMSLKNKIREAAQHLLKTLEKK